MSVLKPRNRLVNFRLSEEEFESMRSACGKSGARSVSDFARGAVLRAMAETERGVAMGEGAAPLDRLDHMVSALEQRVEQLLRLLDGVNGAGASSEVPASELLHS